jgi:glycosyltransferase involved in cell wall biosynthesis
MNGITVGICSFNNLKLLEWTINSLYKNTKIPLQIVIFDNGSDIETKLWCNENLQPGDVYTGNGDNQGISTGFNAIVDNAKYENVFLSDDDMYFLPGWDIITEDINEDGDWIAPMLIESNRVSRSIRGNYGKSVDSFDEERLLSDYVGKEWPHRRRASFLPAAFRKTDFNNIGRYNEEFFVGEADFLWRSFNYYKKLGKEMRTHPKSFIYHLRSGGHDGKPRPDFWKSEVTKLSNYMEKTYKHKWEDYDELMGHYEILKILGEMDILICSWNNLPYLKLCIDSIRKNSKYNHNIHVHLNEWKGNEVKYLEENNINFTRSKENIGLCSGTNRILEHATKECICIFDDDMYALPGWDEVLMDHYFNSPNKNIWVSSFMIEPRRSIFKSVVNADYGSDVNSFREDKLLKEYKSIPIKSNIVTNSNCPLLINREHFVNIGGYDTDFDPGVGAELGLGKRMYDSGCRDFIALKKSLVYHFSSKTTNKVRKNNIGQRRDETFERKYNMTRNHFIKDVLKKDTEI